MSAAGFDAVGTLACSALPADKIRVVLVEGTERISQLYEFVVRIVDDRGPLTEDQLSELLLAPCTLTFTGGAPIHGIAREVVIREAAPEMPGIYDVVLVPTVWLLTVSSICRLYQGMSVKDMAADVLGRYKLTEHCDLRMKGGDPREFCIQYHESDWDFLQRWFEHEGFFYWFEHSADGEKLVVADTNEQTTKIDGNTTLPHRDRGGFGRGEESVSDWRGVERRIPARIVLKDYNEQKPLLPMLGQADVDRKKGFGVVFEYGDNFDTPAAGNALAQKRAERFLTQRLTLMGVTDSPRFHVGHWFQLGEHFHDVQNRKYLVTAITYRLGHAEPGSIGGETVPFRIAFEAIPFDTQFRPERRTPWPSIHGLMHGHIDSDSAGKFSTLDDQARYRVRFPFDSTDKTGEAASIWVRMAQHYAGSAYGSHFPLHKGTEILLAFFDGDPDRPVIVGSIANALTPSPTHSASATQSVIKTASGINITMDDQVGG